MMGNYTPSALKIAGMNTYNTDSTGSRIAWARKQRQMSGHDLARAVDVRNVYISQIENDHRIPSRQVLQQIAEKLGVTVGFLLMETDNPLPVGAEPEAGPVYFSEEADYAAKLIDTMPPEKRGEMLAVLRVMAESALAGMTSAANDKPSESSHLISSFTQRLIQSALLPQSGHIERG